MAHGIIMNQSASGVSLLFAVQENSTAATNLLLTWSALYLMDSL